MPKIRGIKPDLWTDEDFVELSPFARLLWIGMWNYACDNGHLADKSKQIKMRVLPTDDINCAELLRELEQNGRIERSGGVITIPNFVKHQKPDKRYFQTCDVPGCTRPGGDSQPETRGGHDETTTRPRRAHGVVSQGPHVDGDGDGDGDGEVMVRGARKSPARRLPADWSPTESHAAYAATHGIDLDHEAEQFRLHAEANDRRQANWDAAFRQWLGKARKWTQRDQPSTVRHLPRVDQLETAPDGLSDEEYAAWYARKMGGRP